MDPLSFSVPDWKSRFIQHQYQDTELHDAKFDRMKHLYGNRHLNQYQIGFGSNFLAISTKLTFIYLAGLYYARKQFIPGYLYFLNRHYNILGAAKFLVGGYLIGEILSIFTYGQPFLVEDLFRRKLRILSTFYKMEQGGGNT